MRSYAACRDHAADALEAMTGLENVAVRDVSQLERRPGAVTYTCHCKKPADFFLVEKMRREE